MNSKIANALLPSTWRVQALSAFHANRPSIIDPARHANETFEYYSIPAYQDDQHPRLAMGREIGSSKLLLDSGTVLFGKLNPRVEKVWRVGSHTSHRKIGSTEWLPLFPCSEVDEDFLYFLMWSEHVMPKAKTLVSGSTPSRQRVDPRSFYRIEAPLPPFPEQKTIANILGLVQRAIDDQQQLLKLTTELKKTLLHEFFTKGFRGEAQKKTEIGSIPESWELTELGKVVSLFPGYAFKSNEAIESSNTQLVRMGNLYQNKLDLTRNPIFYPDDFSQKHARFVLKSGDLIMSLTGTSGKEDYGFTVELKSEPRTLLLNQRIARIDPITNRVSKDFLFYFLLCRKFLDHLYPTAKGMKQANLSTHAMKHLKVPIPCVAEQQEISRHFRVLDRKIELLESKLRSLQDLFCTLLHQLMTAQIRVNDLELPELERLRESAL